MSGIQNQLSDFYQKHRNETLLVCGCGYSLRQLRHAPNLVSIGVNDVGRWFTPTYLMVVNPVEDFALERYASIQASKAQAVFSPFNLKLDFAPQVTFELLDYGGTSFTDLRGLPFTRNSPYVAICLAAFMGAKRIGVLGVDFTQHHFFAATGTHPLAHQLRRMNQEYARLGEALAHRGIEVVNLSEESRITAFPRAKLATFETATSVVPSLLRREIPKNLPHRRIEMLDVDVDRHGSGLLGACFDSISQSLKALGAKVRRIPRYERGNAAVRFVWNGRHLRHQGALIYCEHGWLPRWFFQMSPLGINADSHCAPFVYQATPKNSDKELVGNFLNYLRRMGPKGYMNASAPPLEPMPKAFFLVPLQIETDTNICRHVPHSLRKMQAFVDYVSRHDPDMPLLFKQHPADARTHNHQLSLKLHRKGDVLVPHHLGNIHQLLKSGHCKGIISLNSNAVHDGLLWGVPSVVLGRNIWPSLGPSPFLRHIPNHSRDLQTFFRDTEDIRTAYCLHLICNQWSLEDLASPQKMLGFLKQCAQWLDRQTA